MLGAPGREKTAKGGRDVELTRELRTATKYKFRSVFMTDRAWCGQFSYKFDDKYSYYQRFFRVVGMSQPLTLADEPNFAKFWGEYCEGAHSQTIPRIDDRGVPVLGTPSPL